MSKEMIPGPANILSCPFCGGKKEVMSLISGNTFGGTVWSDTRRYYPMLPEVSPIQKCPYCNKYFFIEQARQEYSDNPESKIQSFGKLGTLSFDELKQALGQMDTLSLTKMQRWILNHQLFMAYNDTFRRGHRELAPEPTAEEAALYDRVISEFLEGIELSSDYELFHAELLRETGQFEEAKEVLSFHTACDDLWIVEAMLRHIGARDTFPFMLIDKGVRVK